MKPFLFDDYLPKGIIMAWDESKIGTISEGDIDMLKLPDKCTKHNKLYEYYLVIDKIIGYCKGQSFNTDNGIKISTCRVTFKSIGVKTYNSDFDIIERKKLTKEQKGY